MIIYTISIAAALVTMILTRDRVIVFLMDRGLTEVNYLNNKTPNAAGLILMFPCIFAVIPHAVYYRELDTVIYIFVIIALALSGLVDDIMGDKTSKGLMGHAATYINGGFSTGGIKAVIGLIIGLLIALYRETGYIMILVDTVLFALSVNMINLLDLRPGRALKGLFIFLLPIIILTGFSYIWMVLPLIVVLPLYIRGEMNGQYMLGDTGANLIGSILGMYSVFALSVPSRIILAVVLVAVHGLTEFYSITKWIDSVPLLKYIDRLGVKKNGGQIS